MGGGTAHTSISVRPRVNTKYSNKYVKDIAEQQCCTIKKEGASGVDVHNSGIGNLQANSGGMEGQSPFY